MTKLVKFLQDFQGRETKEVFYKQGQEVEFPDPQAQILLADRRVELVDFPQPETGADFLTPVEFENVTGVEAETVSKEGGSVTVVEDKNVFDEPVIPEEATEFIKPKKRGKK